ncbi:blood vessel epicardial substance-like isoform X1 [Branchiostoma floridae]|uniref:Blood vessel epicardial substance-like isoform X1 n=2 Tax=Branchiostoma floridae TaxID=7739 RepID=A0A9J7LPP7_BRAFL|nr:blood vessel epicardial substance-like isoform X1 [Branchiostoma floridae]XP_035686549.1 blood vessel epicardial substance-like isoform X1 [Branchiostoma floridae]
MSATTEAAALGTDAIDVATAVPVDDGNGDDDALSGVEDIISAILPGACETWNDAQHVLFQLASICFLLALLLPQVIKPHTWIFRGLLILGFIFMCLWGGIAVCITDVIGWYILFIVMNLVHVSYLAYVQREAEFEKILEDVYAKIFQPLKVTRDTFANLVAARGKIFELKQGDVYAVEKRTTSEDRIAILISGTLRVSCEDHLLHYIYPNQFIDSCEWEAFRLNQGKQFQVTITAESPCRYICWPREHLKYYLQMDPFLDAVFHNIIGKDIITKLYLLNEQLIRKPPKTLNMVDIRNSVARDDPTFTMQRLSQLGSPEDFAAFKPLSMPGDKPPPGGRPLSMSFETTV